MTTQPFAVDKMLGRLATWLRLIGQDATFGSHLSGRTLVRLARSEGRTVLTRDHKLLRAAQDLPLILVESDNIRQQLRQVIVTCGLDPFAALFTRCTRCNTAAMPVLKADVADFIPAYVLATQSHFACCPRCRRIYWRGTHVDRICDELRVMGYSPPTVA